MDIVSIFTISSKQPENQNKQRFLFYPWIIVTAVSIVGPNEYQH